MKPMGPFTVKQNIKKLIANKRMLIATCIVLALMAAKFYFDHFGR